MTDDYVVVASSSRGTVTGKGFYNNMQWVLYTLLAMALFFTAIILIVLAGVLSAEWYELSVFIAMAVMLYGAVVMVGYYRRKIIENMQYIERCIAEAVECDIYIVNTVPYCNGTEQAQYSITVQYKGEDVIVLTNTDKRQCPDVSWFKRYSNHNLRALYCAERNEVLLLQQEEHAEIL